MFASRIQKTVDIAGTAFVIRALGWKALEAAELESQRLSFARLKEMGGVEVLRQVREAGGAEAARAQGAAERAADPMISVDHRIVLERGLLSIGDAPAAPSAQELDDLLPGIAAQLAREIMQLTKPEAFETEKNS